MNLTKKEIIRNMERVDWEEYYNAFIDKDQFKSCLSICPVGDKLMGYVFGSGINFMVSCKENEFGELILENVTPSASRIIFPSDLRVIIDLLEDIAKTMNVKLILKED